MSASNLAQSARLLLLEWDKTKEHWRDTKSAEFEHQYLEDLPGQVAAAISAMEDMETLLKKVRGDCE
jgi:hypothetical protein